MQMGLHSSQSSRALSPLEREVRKRVWFGCVILDRFLRPHAAALYSLTISRSMSMTFGRPSAIPESYVKIDLPEPYPTSSHSVSWASAESLDPTNVAFYSATM